MTNTHSHYYIPEPSKWPILGMLAVLLSLLGVTLLINDVAVGNILAIAGLGLLGFMLYGWFSDVINENLSGAYNSQVDRSFRQGMFWFIASEVFFFASFFGSLYYIRVIAVGWLGGEGYLALSQTLNPEFVPEWPTNGPGDLGGEFTAMGWQGIPAINTIILLTSGLTLTIAHWGLKKENNRQLVIWLAATILLGVLFVGLQAYEYSHAYNDLSLKLGSGVYGSTFYILTGFHGFHVILGSIMLMAILGRSMKKHFTAHNHFAFEGVAWYWHFVDVVWLGLFIFVYWL